MNLLEWLGPADFVPRHACGQWGYLWYLSVAANAAIGVSYVVIAYRLRQMARHVSRGWQWIAAALFGLFILLCGLGHFCDSAAFFWPAYRFFLLVDLATAAASVGTAVISADAVQWLSGYRRRTPNCLILDDSDITHKILRRLVRDAGFRPISAVTIKGALQNVDSCDLVLADLILPDADDSFSHVLQCAAAAPTLVVSNSCDLAKELNYPCVDKDDHTKIRAWLVSQKELIQ